MTARQSYHLTFARFSPSLSVKSFTASEAANDVYKIEITATSHDSSLPLSSYRPHAGLESVGTEALFNLSIRHNPVVEGIRSADYNYRSADTDLFAEAQTEKRNGTDEESVCFHCSTRFEVGTDRTSK